MAYYTALINAWNSATQPPPGVIGTALTGLTTAQKIAAINAWTVANPLKAFLTPSQILQACVTADLSGLGTANFSLLAILLAVNPVDMSPGTIRSTINTMFAGKTTTLANLAALVAPFDNATQSWCAANGYPTNGSVGNLSLSDANNAGLV